MKKILLLGAAMTLALAAYEADAQRMGRNGGGGGSMGFSGTGQTRGFTSKTGFTKERTNEEDHMNGQDTSAVDSKAADTRGTTDVDEEDGMSPDAADAEEGEGKPAGK